MNKLVLFFVMTLLVFVFVLGGIPPSQNWNQEQIEKLNLEYDGGDFCFAVVSDTHNNLPSFDYFLKSLDNEIEFIILNGDFINEGFDEEYHIALSMFKKTELPLLVTIGNHEIIRNGEKMFQKIFGETYYSFNLSDIQFIILDTSSNKTNQKQIRWLEEELDKDFENRFVFMHHPLFGTAKNTLNKGDSETLNKIFAGKNVSFVFSGHTHNYFHFEDEERDHFLGGSAGGLTKEAMSYSKVCVTDERFSVEKIEFLKQYRVEQLFNMGFGLGFVIAHRIFMIVLIAYFLVYHPFKRFSKK